MKRFGWILTLLVSVGFVVGAWGYAPTQLPTCSASYSCSEAE